MAATKKINYTEYELDWYEKKVADAMAFVDANSPLSDIPDRTEVEPNAKGIPVIKVIAKKEDMIRLVMSILKDMPQMLRDLEELRSAKAAGKMETRGGKKIPGVMRDFLKEREES